MEKFLREFEDLPAYDTEKSKLNRPAVSLIEETMKVIYDPILPAVKFTAEEDNSTIGLANLSTHQVLEYSRDSGSTWINMDTTTTINLENEGDSVYIRGILSEDNTVQDYTQFSMTGKIAASGNCNYIWNYQNPTAPLKEFCGYCLFFRCALTTAPKLPATTLAYGCYAAMFACCPLTAPPALPATTLAEGCYYGMFVGATITFAPELPATTLAESCYDEMFSGCEALTVAPELPATTLASNCYHEMFSTCNSLITAPELPATTLADSCYQYMFAFCHNLEKAPELLPATTLENECYYGMFDSCSSLTVAPELPATNLADCCYLWMFLGCTSLTTAPSILPATTLTERCYYGMFGDCTSLEVAPLLPAPTLVHGSYVGMFGRCSKLNHVECLATDISASWCTDGWLGGVASTGTFIKSPEMNNWSSGADGIPSGWTVKDFEIPAVKFTAVEDNSSVGLEKLSTNQTLEYSTNGVD